MSDSSDNFIGSGSDVEQDEAPKLNPKPTRPLLYLSSSDESSGGEADAPPLIDFSQNTASSSQNKELMIELGLSSGEDDNDNTHKTPGLIFRFI